MPSITCYKLLKNIYILNISMAAEIPVSTDELALAAWAHIASYQASSFFQAQLPPILLFSHVRGKDELYQWFLKWCQHQQ